MTDREMLELAAKAADIEVADWNEQLPRDIGKCRGAWIRTPEIVYWNPLTDDGDALRLAVKLNLTLRCYMGNTCAQATVPGGPSVYVDETNHADPRAATRRAIVRAAAEIGKEMT